MPWSPRSTRPATWSRIVGGEGLDVQAAEGVAGQHVGPGHLCTLEQRVQVGGYLGSVLRAVGGVAPPPAGTVIYAHCAVPGPRRARPNQGRRRPRPDLVPG